MRTLLVAVVALSLLCGTASATENGAACYAVSVTSANILDKLIALVNDHTKRVEAAESIEELEELYAALVTAMKEFAKNNAAEISVFDENITVEKEKEYKAALDAAVKQFEKSIEKKALQFSRK
ncbi:MAG: hypothetical protein IKY73_04935 [Bacteroidaceae bacterium]|nr:hypothetical protein [Bacteroidaceae bacterium]